LKIAFLFWFYHQVHSLLITVSSCSADLPLSFDDRVAAVNIATQFQESSKDVFKLVEEETEVAKTQVTLNN
jgi:hypothetical protein